MNRGFLVRIVICIFIFSVAFYKYINKLNELTQIKLCVPVLEKEIKQINEDNKRLQYFIEKFENPSHLMELVRSPEYAHLKHPLIKNVLKVKEGIALKENKLEKSANSDNNLSF